MIFILPANSNIGRLAIQHLLTGGADPSTIIAGGRSPERLDGLKVATRKADYADPEGLCAAFEGVETLVLIPTTAEIGHRALEHMNALEAAKAAGVRRVVFLSTLAATPGSVAAIAPFYLFAESATRTSGMDWAILRMGLYMEPVADWAPELVETGRLPYPVRQGKAAYVARNDVARAVAAVARDRDRKGEIFDIAAAPVTMAELAQAVAAATGRTIAFEPCTDQEFLDICLKDDPSPAFAALLLSLYKAVEAGEFDVSSNDLERLTGTPAEPVGAFFARLLAG